MSGQNDVKRTIMYVDDDPDDREMLSDAVKEADPGTDVVLAENGLVALKYLQKKKEAHEALPQLIILDINMPYLDGKETFKQIKSDSDLKEIPIVIFTSSQKPDDRNLFSQLGIEFVTKPDSISYLNQFVSRMLLKHM